MPTAVPELIALELIDRLEDITIANGYDFTVPSVDRVNRDGTDWTPKSNTIVVVQTAHERNPELDYAGNPPGVAYILTFTIQGFIRQSDRSATADAALENRMEANIKKAVAGTASWYTFDGNAFNADWGPTTRFDPTQGAHAGISIELQVQYRVSEIDPFSVRMG